MQKQMIINASASEEMRVAILDLDDRGERRLVDLDIENQARSKHKGNIYKGIVANVEDSLEAAFIEFGDDKQAFLALSEVRPALYPPECKNGKRRPKISEVLKRGQEIVVQVTKDEIGNKGAAVTTYLSLPGRYVVLMHSDEAGGGVSRKVEDESARRRAREVLNHIEVPQGMAVIIRTAGVNRPRIDLYRDLKNLAQQWETIDRGAQLGRAPTLLHREPDLVVRTIRDYLAPDITKIVIDAEEEFEDLKAYFEELAPESVGLLEHHNSRQPVFEKYGIENAIEELFERQVKLPSGGYLVIDQTEALVAIDVNSGRSTRETDHEATVYKTNLEAAKEVARHLRLRDMGGIIVVDFIDMVNRRHDRDVERALREGMKDDKARVKISRISENGTLEITRQRLRQAHRLVSHTPCPHCSGTGAVRDPRGLAVRALRELANKVAKHAQHMSRLGVRVPVEVANILSNTKRRELMEMGDEHQLVIEIIADARLQGSEIKYDEERRGKAGLDAAQGVRDPRLNDRRGRRGRGRGREDNQAASNAGPSVPPPTIGPVPTFLDDEAAILEADARDAAEELERERLAAERIANGEVESVEAPPERAPRESRRHQPTEQQAEHFEDPLMEALFGGAPDGVQLADVEAPVEEVEVEAGADGAAKKRRRRRRRKKKGADGSDGSDGSDASDGLSADGGDGGDGNDDDDGDSDGADGSDADGNDGNDGGENDNVEGDARSHRIESNAIRGDGGRGRRSNGSAATGRHRDVGDVAVPPSQAAEEEAAWAVYQANASNGAASPDDVDVDADAAAEVDTAPGGKVSMVSRAREESPEADEAPEGTDSAEAAGSAPKKKRAPRKASPRTKKVVEAAPAADGDGEDSGSEGGANV